MGLFASKQTAPPPVPTDRVIPFRFADDFVYTRGLCLDTSLRFDDVLDPEKLREALDILLNKDGWRKLGARLRLTKDNKLEYHVPAEFSAQRPACLFSTDKQDMRIGDHPVLSKLPRYQSDKPALFDENPKLFRPHMRDPNAPQYLEDWLYADIPQLAIHVLTFHDATIVTITFMHTLTDAMGLVAFIRAWTAVLRGEEDQVPAFVGFDMSDDPVETLHEGVSSSRYLFVDKLVTGWRFFLFVVNFIFEFVFWPKDELLTICVPGAYLTKLRESALAELADEAQQTHGQAAGKPSPPPFLSEGDVLCSWWLRVMLRALNPSPQKTICLMNVFDTRGVLYEMGRVPSPDIAMMANATYPTYNLIPAGQFLSKTVPLSWIASQVRYAIDTLRTPEQVQAQAAGLRDSARKAGRPPLYGDSGMMLVICSNWHRGKLFHMDFSAAVVEDSHSHDPEQIKGYQRGKPSFINSTSTEKGLSIRNSQVILGQDGAGNWWIHSCLRVGAWKKVREQLEGL